MHLPSFSADLSGRAATLAAAGFAVVAGFHLLLALGVPWGRATLGGFNDGTLPPELRVVSSASMAVFIAAAVVVLGRAGQWGDRFSRAFGVGTWIFVIVLPLAALANLASSSPWERFGWAPFTLLLTVATFIAARGRTQEQAKLVDAPVVGSGA